MLSSTSLSISIPVVPTVADYPKDTGPCHGQRPLTSAHNVSETTRAHFTVRWRTFAHNPGESMISPERKEGGAGSR